MTAWRIIKKSYAEIYKNFSAVFIASVIWFLTAGIVLFANFIGINAIIVGQPIWMLPFLALAVLAVGPATTGAFYITNRLVRYKNVSIKDFFIGSKKYFLKSIALATMLAIVAIVLFFDFSFFLNSNSLWMKVASIMWLSSLIFFSMVAIYSFPLLIELDRLDEENSIKNIIKYSAFLTFKEMKFTLFIYLQIVIYVVWSTGLVITLPTLLIGGVSLIANNSTLNLLVKYNVIDRVPGPKDFSQ